MAENLSARTQNKIDTQSYTKRGGGGLSRVYIHTYRVKIERKILTNSFQKHKTAVFSAIMQNG